MKFYFGWSLIPVLLLCSQAGFGRQSGTTTAYPVWYEGGTLGLNHHRVRAEVGSDELTFMQGNQRLTVSAKNITEISCGSTVHRRYAGAMLSAVPFAHLGETEEFYVGVGWTDSGEGEQGKRGQVVLKLSAGEYRDFVAALERLTGRKAVDSSRTPTVVRYEL